jgi:UrcA family protein
MRFTLPLIALAAVAAPVLAAPQADDKVVTLRVAYDDVDLTSAEGRSALEARIDAKLRQACAIDGVARYTYGRKLVDEKCVAEARTAALAEVERVAAAEARRGRAVAAN